MTASRRSLLVFLKLGGSLLSDKRRPRSFRRGVVARLGREIGRALDKARHVRVLLAHGGGGFAHFPAERFRTCEGLDGAGGWRGFAETRRGVMEMNRRVLDALGRGGIFPLTISPGACVVTERGTIRKWDIAVIKEVLAQGRIPLIHGDAVMDRHRGFSIVSTEELFLYLAARLRPARIVLACDVEGVYLDTTHRSRVSELVSTVNRANIAEVRQALKASTKKPSRRTAGWDVTGGMAAKVNRLYELVRRMPGLEARIVTGLRPGIVESALLGGDVGTVMRYR